MNKLFLSLALCAVALAARAQDVMPDTPRDQAAGQIVREIAQFGYLSYSDALRNMPGYADAQRQIQQMRTAYEKELADSKDLFSKRFAEFVDGQQTFPENILLRRQKELEQLMTNSLEFKTEAQKLLQQKEEEVMAPLRRRLSDAIMAVGQARGYAFILNTDNNAVPFVNGALGEDVTAEVMTELGRRH